MLPRLPSIRTRSVFLLSTLLLCTVNQVTNADDWPQWQGAKGDNVWRETRILEKFPEDGPKVVWKIPIGEGYTGPVVVENRVYVMDRQDRKVDAPKDPVEAKKLGVPVTERVLCLNAKTGKEIWKHETPTFYRISYGTGPRTTPTVVDGKLYTLGAMGDLYCFDAATGKVHWHKNLPKDFSTKQPVWGWSNHPYVVGDRLFCLVGGKDHAIVAFDRHSGKVLWNALTSEEVCYAQPIQIKAGGKQQLIVWLSDSLNSVDPGTGKTFWSFPYPENGTPQRPGVSIATPMYSDGMVFVSSFYHGGLMVKLDEKKPTAKVLWRGKSQNPQRPDTINIVMGNPLMREGHIFGVCGFGEFRCLEAKTGKQIWETFEPIGGKKTFLATAFIIPNGNRFFLFNDVGELIIAKFSPKGYQEVDRAKIIAPSQKAKGRDVVWCHPAFANRCMVVRNDKEMICVDLSEPTKTASTIEKK